MPRGERGEGLRPGDPVGGQAVTVLEGADGGDEMRPEVAVERAAVLTGTQKQELEPETSRPKSPGAIGLDPKLGRPSGPSESRVRAPILPVAGSPARRWASTTAARVCGPTMPSIGPE